MKSQFSIEESKSRWGFRTSIQLPKSSIVKIGEDCQDISDYAPHKIRVNVIAPGLVRTPMAGRAQNDPNTVSFIKVKQPLCEDMMEADVVARAAVFLLSDDADAITSDTLTVDAGYLYVPDIERPTRLGRHL